MTASSRRPRPSWRGELLEEDEIDEAKNEDGGAKASQLEWAELECEVQEEKRRRRAAEVFASGRRDNVVAYDDVADEAEADKSPQRSKDLPDTFEQTRDVLDAPPHSGSGEVAFLESSSITGPLSSSPVPALPAGSSVEEREEPLLPDGVITAGQDTRAKKRGGVKKTGAQKRKQSGTKGKEEEDEDEERWVKLRLDGEKKPKRIDATRIVSYYDFDIGDFVSEDMRPQGGVEEGQGAHAPTNGDFRSQLRSNIFDEDDEET